MKNIRVLHRNIQNGTLRQNLVLYIPHFLSVKHYYSQNFIIRPLWGHILSGHLREMLLLKGLLVYIFADVARTMFANVTKQATQKRRGHL